jgi:type I restriction enzyme S subunit
MTKQRKKVPALRFKGFTDDWEQRKLSDLFIKGGSGGTPKSTNKAFYDGDIPFLGISDITKSNGFINNTEKHISSDGLNSSAAWIVSKGAISLAMYASVGKLAILNIDAATSQAFYNMIFDDYDLRDFVYQRLNKANELLEWNKLISTGTQSNLNADKVKNFQMYLPKNHDEIKLISTFFKQIDNTIVLHEEKQRQLERLKKALLQKMFADETGYPALRFKGFTEKWEQHKLGEITDVRDGTHDSPHYVDEGYPLITSKNVSNGRINYDAVNYVSEYDFNQINKRSKVNINDILMGMIGTIGNLALIREDPNFAIKNVALIKYTESINHQFLFQNLQTSYISKELSNSMDGGTQKFISLKKIRNLSIKFPILNEQFEIGQLFQSLDKIITLHDKKIQYLKQLKRGLLQKMFV